MCYNSIIEACGFKPRGESSQIYSINDTEMSLIATAEIPLVGMNKQTIFNYNKLPHKICGISHCFRREAGSHGEKAGGLYRLHQFTKLELVEISKEDESEENFKELIDIQMEFLDSLGISYRVLNMPSEELGSSAYKKYDIEVFIIYILYYRHIFQVLKYMVKYQVLHYVQTIKVED